MNARHALATGLVFLLMMIGASAEIVYSGVQNISYGPFGRAGELDLDADGTVDFELRYEFMITSDVPTSSWGGHVGLRLRGPARVIGTSSGIYLTYLGVLPTAFSVGAQSQSFSWIGAETGRYGVSVGGWSDGLNGAWSGWTGFAGVEDPVFGIELHSSDGVHYGWVRLRFGKGRENSTVYVYDWAYESEPGVPIVARAGTGGVITAPAPYVEVRGPETFGARLAGTKAVPPSSNPLIGTAELVLIGEQLRCSVTFPSEAIYLHSVTSITAVLESAEEQRSFSIYHFVINYASPQGTSTIVAGPVDDGIHYSGTTDLTPSQARSIRLGDVHLKLVLPSGEIRGQVARLLVENHQLEPLSPPAGEYSLLLWPPSEEDQRFPKGVGHGRMHISANREVSLTATLPFGQSIRWDGTLDGTNSIHVTAHAPGRQQSVAGDVRLEQRGGDWVCKGELVWTRLVDSERFRFPDGFENPLRVEGSRFDRNRARATNCTLSLSHGGLGSPITVALKTVLNGGEMQPGYSLEVTGKNLHRVTINADPETGVFRGSFRHPKTRVRVPFAGRLLGDLSGAGSFVSGRGCGAVTIEGLALAGQSTLTFGAPALSRQATLMFGTAALDGQPTSTFGTPAILNNATLTRSPSDPDVVMVSASGTVPDTSYELELIPLGTGPFTDGIYDVLLNEYKVSEVAAMVITTRSTTSAFLRPTDLKGIRVHHAAGSVVLLE